MPLSQPASINTEKPQPFNTLPPLVKRWCYRILIQLGGYRSFISAHGFGDERLASELGLGHFVDQDHFDFDPKKAFQALKEQAVRFEKSPNEQPDCTFERNLSKLADLVGLDDTDISILRFVVMINNYEGLDNTADSLGRLSSLDAFRVLSAVLEIPEKAIRQALSPHGLLARSGLLVLERHGNNMLKGCFELISYTFADNLLSADTDPIELLREVITPSPATTLSWDDYRHVEQTLSLVRSYMEAIAESPQSAVNIFIYGEPGTGKSELARLLAQHLQKPLFEIAYANEDGDHIHSERRLCAYRGAQCLFSSRGALLLFDEADDVLSEPFSLFDRSPPRSRKAWLTKALEQNVVPAIWIANTSQGIDPAILRRFDMVIELPIPSRTQRAHILSKACGDKLNEQQIALFSQSDSLSPALATKAISVASKLAEHSSAKPYDALVTSLINSALRAQGSRTLDHSRAETLPCLYDPSLLNCNSDLMALAGGIKEAQSARICLYGPPGTGKTAYAQWLAQQLDLPLIVKRASDLISMFLGQTERLIAEAFNQATEQQAILLIDEVDSFLQDRRGAKANWEVSMVNEMLTQLEAFDGIFIASTNLMSRLDQAVLRRFDLKIRFDYLLTDQVRTLTIRYCEHLKLGVPTSSELTAVTECQALTPGDFATAARQHRFSPFKTPGDFIGALSREQQIKGSLSKKQLRHVH